MRVIESIDDLSALALDRRVNGLGARDLIALRIPGVARHDQIRMERDLNRYQSRCGCGAGAACFLAVLGMGIVYIVGANHTALSLGTLGDAVALLLMAFVLGLAGKFLALEVTRLQFRGACRRYLKELSTQQSTDRVRSK